MNPPPFGGGVIALLGFAGNKLLHNLLGSIYSIEYIPEGDNQGFALVIAEGGEALGIFTKGKDSGGHSIKTKAKRIVKAEEYIIIRR